MAFAYPIGLLALAGLLVPLFIHLWSVKKGRTLKIGSIALLGDNAPENARTLKLKDILLFILRCLILVLIAAILAQPYLKETNLNTAQKGWILIEKAQFGKIYKGYRNTIDSLLAQGFEIHDFNVGFNNLSLKDSVASNEEIQPLSYTDLIQQLNVKLPKGYSAYIFADKRLVKFDGSQPKVNFKLTWKEVKNLDTIKTWSTTFLAKIYEGKSTPRLTNYIAHNAQNISAVTVFIYQPKGEDAKYVKAALKAITDFTNREFEIITSLPKADVVFWLSEEPPPPSAKKILSYKKGAIKNVKSTLQLSAAPNQTIELKKRIAFDRLKGEVMWIDGWGEPILIKENNTEHYHFYSRFNPQWTDLVWNEQFVKALIPIVLSQQTESDFGFENHDADQRVLNQVLFQDAKTTLASNPTFVFNKRIDGLIWYVVFILLFVERLLSFRHQKKLGNAKN